MTVFGPSANGEIRASPYEPKMGGGRVRTRSIDLYPALVGVRLKLPLYLRDGVSRPPRVGNSFSRRYLFEARIPSVMLLSTARLLLFAFYFPDTLFTPVDFGFVASIKRTDSYDSEIGIQLHVVMNLPFSRD